MLSASVALEQGLLRDYLANRDQASAAWREADTTSSYTLRVSSGELRELMAQIDALLRPLIAAGREDAPPEAELVHVNVFAFPRTGEPWQRRRR